MWTGSHLVYFPLARLNQTRPGSCRSPEANEPQSIVLSKRLPTSCLVRNGHLLATVRRLKTNPDGDRADDRPSRKRVCGGMGRRHMELAADQE